MSQVQTDFVKVEVENDAGAEGSEFSLGNDSAGLMVGAELRGARFFAFEDSHLPPHAAKAHGGEAG